MKIKFDSLIEIESEILTDRGPARSQKYQDLVVFLSNLVDTYLKQGRSGNEQDLEGYSLIHWACVAGDMSLMHRLLALGVDLNQRSDNKFELTPAFFAIKNGHSHLLDFLLTRGVFTDKLDVYGNNFGHIAVMFNQVAILELLINKWKVIIHLPNNAGYYPIHCAALFSAQEALKFLTENGYSIDQPTKDGSLLTHLAIKDNNSALFKLLSDHKVSFNCVDEQGDYPIHIAVQNNQSDFVDRLLSHKIQINQVNRKGQLPINLAIYSGHVVMIDKILFYSSENAIPIPFNRHDPEGNPLFHSMIRYLNDENIVNLLPFILEKKGFIWWCNSKGQSPVMLAIKYGRINTLKFLLANEEKIKAVFDERGCEFEPIIQQQANSGKLPIHYAIKLLIRESSSFSLLADTIREIFLTLKQYGASYLRRTSKGVTARKMLYQIIPKSQQNLDLWEEMIVSLMREDENLAFDNSSYFSREERIEILLSLLTKILVNSKPDICLNHLKIFINASSEQKFKLILTACLRILMFYVSIKDGKLRILSNSTLILFNELFEEQSLDPHDYFTHQTIVEVGKNLIDAIEKNLFINMSYPSYLFDNYLYFVCTVFPRYYVPCLFNLKDSIKLDAYYFRLCSEHGLGIKVHPYITGDTDHIYEMYSRTFREPYSSFFIRMPISPDTSNSSQSGMKKYLSSEIYSEHEISSYLQILSSIMINGSQLAFGLEEMKKIKTVFFYFFHFAEIILEKRYKLSEDESPHKLHKDDYNNSTEDEAKDFYEGLGFEKNMLLALKKLLRNMNAINDYFSFHEKIYIYKKVHQRFPTLTDLCIINLYEMEQTYEEGMVSQVDGDAALAAFNLSNKVYNQAHFLKQLGIFASHSNQHLTTIELENPIIASMLE
jgi:ankyrin repeat protein